MIPHCALLTLCLAIPALASDDIASAAREPHLLAEYINNYSSPQKSELTRLLH